MLIPGLNSGTLHNESECIKRILLLPQHYHKLLFYAFFSGIHKILCVRKVMKFQYARFYLLSSLSFHHRLRVALAIHLGGIWCQSFQL